TQIVELCLARLTSCKVCVEFGPGNLRRTLVDRRLELLVCQVLICQFFPQRGGIRLASHRILASAARCQMVAHGKQLVGGKFSGLVLSDYLGSKVSSHL